MRNSTISPAARLVMKAFWVGLVLGAIIASAASLVLDPPYWHLRIIW